MRATAPDVVDWSRYTDTEDGRVATQPSTVLRAPLVEGRTSVTPR
jgi:hypothetical protein